jgi:lipopolysaccharide biosynthesis glycosyltransferase
MLNYVIVTKSDRNFFSGLVALIESLKIYEPKTPVIVLDCGLDESQLKYCIRNNCEIYKGNIDNFNIPEIKNCYTKAIYGFLGFRCNRFPLIVHLDADAVVLGSLETLVAQAWEHGFAAVPDYPPLTLEDQVKNDAAKQYIQSLIPDIDFSTKAFNAGVFALRNDYYEDKMRPMIDKLIPIHEKLWGNDQAILNLSAYFVNPKESFRDVGYAFNTRPTYSRSPSTEPLKVNFKDNNVLIYGIAGRAKILHFIGKIKPWQEDYDSSIGGFRVWEYFFKKSETLG